jgi:hypothetical protein
MESGFCNAFYTNTTGLALGQAVADAVNCSASSGTFSLPLPPSSFLFSFPFPLSLFSFPFPFSFAFLAFPSPLIKNENLIVVF